MPEEVRLCISDAIVWSHKPIILNKQHVISLNEEDFNKEKRKAEAFLENVFEKNTKEFQENIDMYQRQIKQTKSALESLWKLKDQYEKNLSCIKEFMYDRMTALENREKKKVKRKQKLSLEEEEQALLEKLATVRAAKQNL